MVWRISESAVVMSDELAHVIPLLVDVKDNLDSEITLDSLARDFGASRFHFHRTFSTLIGETPRRHVARLRLERAAYKIAITDETILDVALAVGFNSHETFSRAFRRHFGQSPQSYRGMAKAAQRDRMERNGAFRGDGCLLSEVRFEVMRTTPALAIRHVGAYSEFGAAERARLAAEMVDWAGQSGVAPGPLRLGLFPDDPTMTPRALQQSDFCIPLDRPAAGTQRIRCIELAGGMYGVIEHIGPSATVDQAYRNLADGIRRSRRFGFREDPPIHVYLDEDDRNSGASSHSKVCFPVRRTA